MNDTAFPTKRFTFRRKNGAGPVACGKLAAQFRGDTSPTSVQPERLLKKVLGVLLSEGALVGPDLPFPCPDIATILDGNLWLSIDTRLFPTGNVALQPLLPGILEDRRWALTHALAHVVLHTVECDPSIVTTASGGPETICCGASHLAAHLSELSTDQKPLKLEEQADWFASALVVDAALIAQLWTDRYKRPRLNVEEAMEIARQPAFDAVVTGLGGTPSEPTDEVAVDALVAPIAVAVALPIHVVAQCLRDLRLLGSYRNAVKQVAYEVEHECGHKWRHLGDYGSAEMLRFCGHTKTQPCPDCYRSGRQPSIRFDPKGFPCLNGTLKQVVWAGDVRARCLAALVKLRFRKSAEVGPSAAASQFERALSFVKQPLMADASLWIALDDDPGEKVWQLAVRDRVVQSAGST